MSMAQLNELLAHVLDDMGRQGLTIVTKDDNAFKPWLPASYWAEQAYEADRARAVEWRRQLDEVSVADVLEEGIPSLKGDDVRMERWGTTPMRDAGGLRRYMAPHEDDPQPSYDYECYQCGRPITRHQDCWVDHTHTRTCDLALLSQEMIDGEEYWTYHQPKPVRGEEEDDDAL